MDDSGICQICDEYFIYCQCLARNPEHRVPQIPHSLFLSIEEIFQRLDAICQLVATKNHKIPKAACQRIGEELVKLGYELMEANE